MYPEVPSEMAPLQTVMTAGKMHRYCLLIKANMLSESKYRISIVKNVCFILIWKQG